MCYPDPAGLAVERTRAHARGRATWLLGPVRIRGGVDAGNRNLFHNAAGEKFFRNKRSLCDATTLTLETVEPRAAVRRSWRVAGIARIETLTAAAAAMVSGRKRRESGSRRELGSILKPLSYKHVQLQVINYCSLFQVNNQLREDVSRSREGATNTGATNKGARLRNAWIVTRAAASAIGTAAAGGRHC